MKAIARRQKSSRSSGKVVLHDDACTFSVDATCTTTRRPSEIEDFILHLVTAISNWAETSGALIGHVKALASSGDGSFFCSLTSQTPNTHYSGSWPTQQGQRELHVRFTAILLFVEPRLFEQQGNLLWRSLLRSLSQESPALD